MGGVYNRRAYFALAKVVLHKQPRMLNRLHEKGGGSPPCQNRLFLIGRLRIGHSRYGIQ